MATRAKKARTAHPLNPPTSTRQIAFYQLLVAARKKWFMDALSEALGHVEPATVKTQIGEFVPATAQRTLAAAGVRDEHVFPLPIVLEAKPWLVGYYRMLLGASQKSFYKGSTGMGTFKSMEETGTINEKQKGSLPAFCKAMAVPLAQMVRQVPALTERDLRELPLLTFGAQLQGSNNTEIGKKAMRDVFEAVTEIVRKYVTKKEPTRLIVRNASGRTVHISLFHDPDVSIQEMIGNRTHNKVAIEVKGGTDVSNVHNRAGEAEKSHLKAKKRGFKDFWTIISKHGVDLSKLMQESQTTTEWFDVAELLAREGRDWDEFRERLAGAVGIRLRGA
ncbi:MAG: XcyI family restriction endonuclease [Candidatus Acidiferrales bacterium]